MNDATSELFRDLEILEILEPEASPACRRATATAGRLAVQMGATVWSTGPGDLGPDRSFALAKSPATPVMVAEPTVWAARGPNRVLLVATTPDGRTGLADEVGTNVVRVSAEPWHNEATLFAASGLADLFGEPDGAPLVPAGEWGACTIAYAVLGALASAQALAMAGHHDVALVDCVDALRWVNWKSPALAWAGSPVTREGAAGAWPVLPCADGFVALVFTARDWNAVVEMVDDERLRDERFARHRSRMEHRDEYTEVLREWAHARSKSEIDELLYQHKIPGAAVLDPVELLDDPTMVHRAVFAHEQVEDLQVPTPVAPVRVYARPGGEPLASVSSAGSAANVDLPLAGVRVLDLGVLTAGAGSSSLLADLGAEVLKVESATKPDMFRFWAGDDDSPLFDFSNRSKYGIDLNLKEPAGRAAFLELVAGADAVIENYRRGVLERLELGFDSLCEANPRIVLGSVSGQGLTGPRADHTTFGSTLEASSGLAALTAGPSGLPTISGSNLNFPDQTVCLFAGAVLAAAISKSRATGTAFHLDISQRDVAAYACAPVIEQVTRGGTARQWQTTLSTDGTWIAAGEDASEIPVLDGQAVLEACTSAGSSAIVEAPNGNQVKGFPFTLTNRTLRITRPAPAIGEHNDLFLRKDVS